MSNSNDKWQCAKCKLVNRFNNSSNCAICRAPNPNIQGSSSESKTEEKGKEYAIIAAIPHDDTDLNDFIPNELLLFGCVRDLETKINLFQDIQTPLTVIHLIESYFDLSFNYQYIFVTAIKFSNYNAPSISIASAESIIHELKTMKNLSIKFDEQKHDTFWEFSQEMSTEKEKTSMHGISNITLPKWI
eukprot:341672_1